MKIYVVAESFRDNFWGEGLVPLQYFKDKEKALEYFHALNRHWKEIEYEEWEGRLYAHRKGAMMSLVLIEEVVL